MAKSNLTRKPIFKFKTMGVAHTHFFFEKRSKKLNLFGFASQISSSNRTYVRFNIKVYTKLFQKFPGLAGSQPRRS